jgi:pimeloyl-ACP methyl ester carboxylesterase
VDEEHRRALADGAVADQVAADAQARVFDVWVPVAGVAMHSHYLGAKAPGVEPLVLLHGLGVSAASLAPLARRLAGARRVVSCDLPGFGRSASDEIWSTERITEAVGELLDAEGFTPAVLVGHSYGCHVAASLAARHPGRVSSLVMLSPAFDRRFGSPFAQMLRLTLDALMERPALVGGGIRDYLRAGPRRVIATLREAASIPLDELVGAVRCPVLIVRGSRDALTTARWAEDLRRSCGGPARVAVIPRAAHALGHEAPGAAAGAIEAFLGDVEPHPSRMAREASRPG